VPSAKDSEEISLFDLAVVLAEQRRTIMWVAVCFCVLSVLVSLLLPKKYTATVTLLPPQQNTSISSAIASQLGNLGGMAALAGGSLGVKNPNEMYVAMLKSRTVEDAMVRRFGLMQQYKDTYPSDARKDFESHATVDGNAKDGLIHISVEDRDPNRASELANGYVEEFRKLSEHLAITEAGQRRVFFEGQLEQAKDNLGKAEEALKKTQQSTGLIQLDSQSRALIESAAAIRAQITAREVQIQGLQTYATSENAELVKAERELQGLRAQLAKLGGSEDTANGFLVPKGKVPEAGLEYIRKFRDVKYYETIFEILARQFELAKLDEAKQGAVIQVVDAAVPPDKRSFPKRTLIVLVATLFGLIVGVAVAFVRVALRNFRAHPEAGTKIAMLRQALK
jgi:uncharacterized protein involved in exopolysaccharide biosynthesis